MPRLPRLRAIAVAALITALTVGCASSTGASDTPTTPGRPTVGGTAVVRLAGEPTTLDPHKTNDPLMWAAMVNVGGALLTRDPGTGKITAGLATSWTASNDGLEYEFTLREGVTFHNGDPLTADDYAFTIMRAIKPETRSPVAGTIFLGVRSAEAKDPHTLHLSLAVPNASLLINLTDPVFAMPLSRRYVESAGAESLARKPIGVGPYKVAEWRTGEKIVLERNPAYTWGPASAPGPAYLQTIELPFVADYSTALTGFESGSIDVLTLDAKDVARVEGARDRYQIHSSLASGIDPLVHLNDSRAPFDNEAVRRAVNMAVDRKLLIDVVALGQGQVQSGPLSPSVNGYDPAVEKLGFGFDPDAAGAALQQAGVAGRTFRLIYASEFKERRQLAEVLQQQLAAVGLTVEIVPLEGGVFAERVAAGDFDMSLDGWGWFDASLLYSLFHSSMVGVLNESHLKDPALDAILDTMFTAADGSAFTAAASRAQTYIAEHALVVPLYAKRNVVAVAKRIQGAGHSELTGRLDLTTAFVAQ